MTVSLEDKYVVWIVGGLGIVGFLAYMRYSTVKSERDRLVAANNAARMNKQISQLVEDTYRRAVEDSARAASQPTASDGRIIEMPPRKAEGFR